MNLPAFAEKATFALGINFLFLAGELDNIEGVLRMGIRVSYLNV